MSQGRYLFGGPVNAEALKDPEKASREIAQSMFRGIKSRVDRMLPIPQAATFVQAYLKASDEQTVTDILNDFVDERLLALNKKAEVRKTRRNVETYEAEAAAAAEHYEAVDVREDWLCYLELIRQLFGKAFTFRELVDMNQLF